ncbi:hypothetical protein HOD75_02055 [archaeon]|jgi:hypothetical protein|nr:hypothetical protein [archaeon]MBT4241660.1 hypothetical protein [archaeon]MBT4418055.1 hypothetical protein [archaeon]
MILKRGKSIKAQGHVEIIISLILFVGVILFFLTVMNPFAKPKQSFALIGDVEDKIINEINYKFGRSSVIVGELSLIKCYDIDFPVGKRVYEVAKGRKYDLYFSDDVDNVMINKVPNNVPGCGEVYKQGIYFEEDIIVYEKIENLKTTYETDYSLLKNNLGVISDFSFSLMDLNRNLIVGLSVDKEPPVGVNVESKELPIIVIDANGGISELIINIRAW